MIRPNEREDHNNYITKILDFHNRHIQIPGAATKDRADTLAHQIIESVRRTRYTDAIQTRHISENHLDPESSVFNPLKAAVLFREKGEYDEACWLVFLATHFSFHEKDGWRLCRDIYKKYDGSGLWTWKEISNNFEDFKEWYRAVAPKIRTDGIRRRFGSHRKYETLKPDSHRGPISVIESYVRLIGPNRGHANAFHQAGVLPNATQENFDILYEAFDSITSFGRTGKFDFLTMLAKLRLIDAEPSSPCLVGASGPLYGAKLLFTGDPNSAVHARDLERDATLFGRHLGVSMQVVEDALCNWQKSPEVFIPFRG